MTGALSPTVVVLQARLDSSRLPGKALFDLAGKPVISRAMESLRAVPADRWVLACDEASYDRLEPFARESGFECVAGPKEDVLARFCLAIEKTGAATVLRATGDNPFVFADAAAESLKRFEALKGAGERCDYFTFTGMPHGSGVEVFDARRLIEACRLTDSPYDHEHVGPAMYAHRDRFFCVFENSPQRWLLERARITIDTQEDFDRACAIARRVLSLGGSFPFSSEDVIAAWRYVDEPILAVAANGPGTGHRSRMRDISVSLSESFRVIEALYDPRRNSLSVIENHDASCGADESDSIQSAIPRRAALVIVDAFRSSHSIMKRLSGIGPVVTLDDGGPGRNHADYVLDIIPGSGDGAISVNRTEPGFLPLPANRRKINDSPVTSALVVAGGDNGASLALPVARVLASLIADVTVIDPACEVERTEGPVRVIGPVAQLRERLCEYDLIVTHYGFTAFEALAAGSRVLLFSPTRYHYRLARGAGFSAIPFGKVRSGSLSRAMTSALSRAIEDAINERPAPLPITPETESKDLSAELKRLATGIRVACPLCGSVNRRRVLARAHDRTVVSCARCGMDYLSYHIPVGPSYGESYFFEEYRSQYGKTYLEDFDAIKARGLARMRQISRVRRLASVGRSLPAKDASPVPAVFDVGCAYGPFLAAARDCGWNPSGTDVCQEAVSHVRDVLGIPAVHSFFPSLHEADVPPPGTFDAVTLWFVIEHIDRLAPVFERIRALLRPDGILAFSTPSAVGISATRNRASFFKNGPLDHYTIWNPRTVRKQLSSHGFIVRRIVSTGHHPERFPLASRIRPGSFVWKALELASRFFSLGDTFEVYASKASTGKASETMMKGV